MANSSSDFFAKVKAFYKGHPVISGLCLMALSMVILLWLAMVFLDFWTDHGDNATVPQVKNMSYDSARALLEEHNQQIVISDSIYDTSLAPGTVIESWPKAGATVKSGRQVYVTLTAFSPKLVSISAPVTGVSVRQAISYLNALGIKSIRQVSVPSEYPDLVESAHADGRPIGVGSMLPVDASVVLEVGTLPEPLPYDELTDSLGLEPAPAVDDDDTGYSTYTDDEL